MRLSSINPKLEDLFVNPRKVEQNFSSVFWYCFSKLPEKSFSEIKKYTELNPLLLNQMPNLHGRRDIVDKIDNDYFEKEDVGEFEAATILFKIARIAASVVIQSSAIVPADFSEAAYESIMSTDDPKFTAREILEMLD